MMMERYMDIKTCRCIEGVHIWDNEFAKMNPKEQLCVCCNHIFLNDDKEDEEVESSINLDNKSINQQSNKKSKGVIRRINNQE